MPSLYYLLSETSVYGFLGYGVAAAGSSPAGGNLRWSGIGA